MTKHIIWLLVSCLMVAALVLASCGPAVTEEEEEVAPPTEEEVVAPPTEEEEVVTEGPEMVQDSLGRLVEKPKYGGVIALSISAGPSYFDEIRGQGVTGSWSQYQTNGNLMRIDWAKGIAGTGETSLSVSMFPSPSVQVGHIAESWEITEPDTVVFHIRQGIYFHDKPPTNGRELTADDVAFTFNRIFTSITCYYAFVCKWDKTFESITAPDKWTVVVKCKPERLGIAWEYMLGSIHIIPPEPIEEYGDLTDWRNSVCRFSG